jgi:hypothetical protein
MLHQDVAPTSTASIPKARSSSSEADDDDDPFGVSDEKLAQLLAPYSAFP